MTAKNITLNDGNEIPQFGFGVWQVSADEAQRVVSDALDLGYRHIDTAQMYGNEEGVGAAIAASGIPRDELFVTTKLNNDKHAAADVVPSLRESLSKLGLEKVDLFLIHWPLPTRYDGDYVSTWRELVKARELGLTDSIGVSNFEPAHLERIVAETGESPAVNQIEVHPYFPNTRAREATLALGAHVESWSPLGRGEISDPAVAQIADALGKTPAQVIVRWHLQQGLIVFPKSTNRERIEENAQVFDFELTDAQMDALAALDRGEDGRTGAHPEEMDYIPG